MEISGGVIFGAFVIFAVIWGYFQNKDDKARGAERDRLDDDIGEITDWLIEIDPRFDDERELYEAAWDAVEDEEGISFAPADQLKYTREKRERGERTLKDPLRRHWRDKQKKKEESG
jgi:hypothetical protein